MRLLLIAMLLVTGAATSVCARAESDQQDALEAVASGKIRPLNHLLPMVRRDFKGQVLDAELYEQEDGWVYRIKMLNEEGTVQEIMIDARTATVLNVR